MEIISLLGTIHNNRRRCPTNVTFESNSCYELFIPYYCNVAFVLKNNVLLIRFSSKPCHFAGTSQQCFQPVDNLSYSKHDTKRHDKKVLMVV